MVDSKLSTPPTRQVGRGIAVSELPLPLLDAVQRLINFLDEPENIPALAPLVQREIMYRLLVASQGARLRQIALAGSHSHQVARAIDWLKSNFARSLRVDDLAAQVNMSTSAFYHHFRSTTALSPLQFQKHLRLQEARRLMVVDQLDATSAAVQVGYESPSQFSREYSRLFGVPPARDAKSLRQLDEVGTPSEVLVG
jgi:AraC-like DNA-binding protein